MTALWIRATSKNPWHELISPPENNEIHLLSTNIFPVDER